MDSKHIIKEFRSYVDGFVECCTSDHETHELLKAVDKLIEEQEERIAIMAEGGWHKITLSLDSLPKESGDYIVAINMPVIGNNGKEKKTDLPQSMFYNSQLHEFYYCGIVMKPHHWMELPKPPKRGE